jgi:hypothetical protein
MDERLEPAPDSVAKGRMSLLHQPRLRLGAVIALAAAAGVVAWAIVGTGNNSSSSPTRTRTVQRIGPVALSEARLKTRSKALGQPIYWAGPRQGYTYELTRTTTNKVYVRYLSRGVRVGDKRAIFLIVATYPFRDAYAALRKVGRGNAIKLPDGGVAVVQEGYPKSVHLAFPGVDYQVEVYHPSPERSLHVAVSGAVAPVR